MEIKLVEQGLANRYSDCIEIHKDLPNYPELYNPILEHELTHTDKKFSFKDLRLDITKTPGINYKELYKFMLKRPSTWVQWLPLWKHKERGFVFDLNLTIIYSAIILIWGWVGYVYVKYAEIIFGGLI